MMKKTMMKTLITTALLAIMFAVMPISGSRAEAAAKKPGAVKKIETVKVTKNSIRIKYSKAKGAKEYQITVYNGKEKVKSMKSKKTTCTVKDLKPSIQYTIKVCGYNGTAYGKKASAKIYTADKDGIVGIGRSTATGKALEREYKAWRDSVIKEAEDGYVRNSGSGLLNRIAGRADVYGYRCTKAVTNYQGNPNQYDRKNVYETYKKGMGTNLELYQLLLDIANKSGKIECEILEDEDVMYMANWTDGWRTTITPGRLSGSRIRKK